MRNLSLAGKVAGGNLATITQRQELQNLALPLTAIRQLDGLYCLNDLHRLAGSSKKQSPYFYLKSPQGKEMLSIYETQQNYEPLNRGSYICLVKGKGKQQGTYANLAIALDYASWIDKRFFIALSQLVEAAATGGQVASLANDVQHATRLLNQADNCTSIAGRILCVIGKHKKPLIKTHLNNLLDRQQLKLTFGV